MSKIQIIKEKDLVSREVADKRQKSLHEEIGSKMQQEAVRDAIFSIYGVETIDELFSKTPKPELENVKKEISDALEREVDALGYS